MLKAFFFFIALGPKLYHLLFTWLHYFLSSRYSKIVQTSKIIWISMRQLLVNMWISPHYLDFSSVLIPTTKARDRHQILFLLGEQHRRQIALIGICGRSVLVSPFYIQSYFSNPIATVDMFNWSRYKILEYSSAWACFSSKGCGEHKIWGVLYHSTFVFFFVLGGGGGVAQRKWRWKEKVLEQSIIKIIGSMFDA